MPEDWSWRRWGAPMAGPWGGSQLCLKPWFHLKTSFSAQNVLQWEQRLPQGSAPARAAPSVKPAWPGRGSDVRPGAAGPSGGVGGPGDAAWLCRLAGKAHPGARARSTAPRRPAPGDAGGEDVPGEVRTDGRSSPSHAGRPGKKPGCLRRGGCCRLPCAWPGTALPAPAGDAVGTAQLQLQVQLLDGSHLVLLWVQVQFLTDSSSSFPAPFQGWLWLVSVPVRCGSTSVVSAPVWLLVQLVCSFRSVFLHPFVSGPAPGRLRLSFGSSSFAAPIWFCPGFRSSLGTAPVHFQLICSFRSTSWMALARIQLGCFCPGLASGPAR
ncbi:uncharacterized protein LOC142082534 [Calonectris borealis]|uniref:uncharacterized protein LOC142082534 n=1 Tax=Calonectris borealis TaxID=1323832 RepID=UPI003F4B309A